VTLPPPPTYDDLRQLELKRSRAYDLARAARLRAEADDLEHRTDETRAAQNAAFQGERRERESWQTAVRRRENADRARAAVEASG
jgi:hypothetical protein